MTFQVLASGSRANAIIVTAGSTRLLIDCGLSRRELFKRLHAHGYKAEELTAILLTHEHGDHAGHAVDVARSTGALLIDQELNQCPECGSTPRLFENGAQECLTCGDKGGASLIGDVVVMPFAVPHDAAAPVGYLLEHDGQRIAIATDLGHITPQVAGCLRLAHLLYLESNHDMDMLAAGPYEHLLRSRIVGPLGHLSNDATAAFLREQLGPETRHITLGHLSTVANTPELCEAIARRALADRAYTGSLEVLAPDQIGERITL
jgi:phosphoribosyl 1,2-cyclic phosphodiesterase